MPLILFGWPDMAREETRFALEIPRLGSVILTHSLDGQIKGLKEFAREDRPNSTVVFWTFRVMVGLGVMMIVLGVWSLILRMRRGDALYRSRLFLRAVLWMGPAGLIAILAGWFTTEIGRQPWVVYGIMRTKDAVSSHGVAPLALTLMLFVVVYFFVFGAGFAYILRLVCKGPVASEGKLGIPGGPGQGSMRPPSGAKDDSPPAESSPGYGG